MRSKYNVLIKEREMRTRRRKSSQRASLKPKRSRRRRRFKSNR
jgi:hypothetical protein